jgi:predicted DNA-binding transcriptional regulator AlpA
MNAPDIIAALSERLLTEDELARLLHVELQQVERLRTRREGPPVVRVAPRTVRYRLADVERWLASRTQMPRQMNRLGAEGTREHAA